AQGDVDAEGEARVVGEEVADQGPGLAVEDLDAGAAAGAGADEDVGDAVVVNVAHGDADAAGEAGVEGEEAIQELAGGAVDVDLRPAGGAGPGRVGLGGHRGPARRGRRRGVGANQKHAKHGEVRRPSRGDGDAVIVDLKRYAVDCEEGAVGEAVEGP